MFISAAKATTVTKVIGGVTVSIDYDDGARFVKDGSKKAFLAALRELQANRNATKLARKFAARRSSPTSIATSTTTSTGGGVMSVPTSSPTSTTTVNQVVVVDDTSNDVMDY